MKHARKRGNMSAGTECKCGGCGSGATAGRALRYCSEAQGQAQVVVCVVSGYCGVNNDTRPAVLMSHTIDVHRYRYSSVRIGCVLKAGSDDRRFQLPSGPKGSS